jgi:uncharacterized membrane protein YgaE (UPF0421/DUF939 family)
MQKEISITEANNFMSSWVNNYKKEQEDNKYQTMLDSFSKEELVQNYETLLSEKFDLEKNLDLLKNENNFLKEENERLQLSLLVSARNS